jgi:hypothetical protein
MVTVCWPHWKVLVTLLNMLMGFLLWATQQNWRAAWRADHLHKTRKHNPEHDAIPEPLNTARARPSTPLE